MKIGALDFRSMFPQHQPQTQDGMQRHGLLAARSEQPMASAAPKALLFNGVIGDLIDKAKDFFSGDDEEEYSHKEGGYLSVADEFEDFKSLVYDGLESPERFIWHPNGLGAGAVTTIDYRDMEIQCRLYVVPEPQSHRGSFGSLGNGFFFYELFGWDDGLQDWEEEIAAAKKGDLKGRDLADLEEAVLSMLQNVIQEETEYHEFTHVVQAAEGRVDTHYEGKYSDNPGEVEAFVGGACYDLLIGVVNAETSEELETVLATSDVWDEDPSTFADTIFDRITEHRNGNEMNRAECDKYSYAAHEEINEYRQALRDQGK